jgi:hypothetical protein
VRRSELGGAAQLSGCDFREDEAVVPLAAGLLQGGELSREVAGSDSGPGSGLGEIACKLGALADFMQLSGAVGGLGRVRLAPTRVPVADQRDQVGLAERERSHGSQRVLELREDEWKLVALFVENLEQMIRLLVARALELAPKTAGLAAQAAVGGWRAAGGRGFGANEFALDVDIADLAGGLTQPLEQAERLALLLFVRGKAGKHGEQGELGFDAAG